MHAALAVGADTALGSELPENTSYKLLFCAARRLVQEKLQGIDPEFQLIGPVLNGRRVT
jgi:hypothetical protein